MLCLKARFDGQTLRFPLPKEAVKLGSAPGTGIRLPFPGVSRLHALVEPVAGGIALRDLGSRNGLFFEGRRQREALLAPGGEVGIGDTLVSLEEAATSDVELALLVEVGGASSPGERRSEEHDTGTASSLRLERGARDAMRLVRECEAARDAGAIDPGWVLAQAATVLGAIGLALWDRAKHGPDTLLASWGVPPTTEGPDGRPVIDWRASVQGRDAGCREAGLSA